MLFKSSILLENISPWSSHGWDCYI